MSVVGKDLTEVCGEALLELGNKPLVRLAEREALNEVEKAEGNTSSEEYRRVPGIHGKFGRREGLLRVDFRAVTNDLRQTRQVRGQMLDMYAR